jgi:hypothetical protein
LFHFVLRSDDEQKENWYRIGFLREDSINRVFFRNELTLNEILILDFNVGIKDTIQLGSLDTYDNEFEVYVDSIDTITVENVERKRYFLYTEMAGFSTEVWIEGIGSLSGFPFNYFGLVGGDSYFLLCAHISDTLIYHKPEFSTCWETTSNIDKQINTSTYFTVSPNPIENVSILNYQGEYTNDIIIEFRSINGGLIYQQVMKPDENIEIDREDFESGLYIVTLKSSKLLESIKVIVL